MEGPASAMCLRTCYVGDTKPLQLAEDPPGLGQARPAKNWSCSRRMTKQRRSNSISRCTLPIIPEYPGFQDVKLPRNYSETPAFNGLFQDLGRGKSSSSQLNDFLNRASLAHCLGSSPRGYLKGHPTTRSGFHDKPLQEYFNERLTELRNYSSKRCPRKAKALGDKSQNPLLACRGSRRRSSCSAVLMLGHSQESGGSCSSANQDKKGVERSDQEEPQDVPDLYNSDFLDILTMHVAAPLEAFVQKQ